MPNSTEKTPKKTTRSKSPAASTKPRAKSTKASPAAPEITETTAVAVAEPTTIATTSPRVPTRDEIAQRAHELYVKSGFVAGRDLEFWLEAERQLRSGK